MKPRAGRAAVSAGMLAAAATAVRAARLTRARRGLALVYHEVARAGADTAGRLVPTVPDELFRWQLGHLRRHYRVVNASELHPAVMSRRRGEPFPVAVTFDDDLRSHRRTAMPALQAAGVPATFFLCGASLERPFSFWWETVERAAKHDLELPEAVPAFADRLGSMDPRERDRIVGAIEARLPPVSAELGMPAADVEALVSAGFEVGFHTLRHPVLTTLDDEGLRDAMAAGREQLSAVARDPLTTIAYPYGEADDRVASAAAAVGFTAGFTTAPEPVRPGDDPLRVGRIYAPATKAGFALGVARALLTTQPFLTARTESSTS